MKRKDLIKIIAESGAIFVRHGGNHDWYVNRATGVGQAIPRHAEINESLARGIIKKLS